MTTQDQRDRILVKAYEIWEAEGRPQGRDMEHWMKAELEIGTNKAKAKAKPAAKKPAAKKPAAKKPAAKKPAAKKPAAKAKAKAPAKPKR